MKTIFQKISLIIALGIFLGAIIPHDFSTILILIGSIALGIYIDPFSKPIKK